MKQLTINYDQKPIYDIVIDDTYLGLGDRLEKLGLSECKICIVSDSHVAPLYLEEVKHIVAAHCSSVTDFVFDAGEASKNLDTVQNLYEHLIHCRFERRDLLIALGGGVVGDLTGYAAATFLRGISFIQLPTSLLAQVDSSIGGKTGVDFRSYKNMVGAFHQPKLVYTNVEALKTLTERQYISGLGEIIKHGLIKDANYYAWLKEHRDSILALDSETLIEMILRSDQIKQKVVENDPLEKGERAHLNFGHTLGHSVEKLMNFSMLHGECVAIGMTGALELSVVKGNMDRETADEVIGVIKAFGLPVTCSGVSSSEIVEVSKNDKKMDKGKVKFILLEKIGKAYTNHEISDDELLLASRSMIQEM